MRLSIKLCKYCLRNKDECEHYQAIKAGTKKIKVVGTLLHNCKEYYTTIPIGTVVEIELKELEFHTEYGMTDGEGTPIEMDEEVGEWVSAGFAQGKVVDTYNGGFFVIELFKPVELCLPESGRAAWSTAKSRTVTHRAKRACDIKIVEADNA